MSTRSPRTSRRRWLKWPSPLLSTGSMLARSNSWPIGPLLPVRTSPFWMCKLPTLMLQTPLPNLLPPRRKILLKTLVGGGRSETAPPATAIDSLEGGASGEGKTEDKKEDAPAGPSEGPSNDPPTPVAMSESALPPPAFSGPQDPEDPACGEKI
ncbi:UNVERIFIED_CONTAM: hypothetical protein Sradi_3665400 [Sesamum radiatum]|uniref:Uncharacterized protein n=1 Tax=Sesamum radiatum TaxID=300843 RepID=A0AAW2QIW5_SESRA